LCVRQESTTRPSLKESGLADMNQSSRNGALTARLKISRFCKMLCKIPMVGLLHTNKALASADIVRRFRHTNTDWSTFPDKVERYTSGDAGRAIFGDKPYTMVSGTRALPLQIATM
jgi:hypothetical protein